MSTRAVTGPPRWVAVMAVVGTLSIAAPACSGGGVDARADGTPPAESSTATVDECDSLDPAHCLLPFPSDHFTVPDDTTPTGRRVAIAPGLAPRGVDAPPVDAAEWNRNDGASPNTPIMTVVPGLDAEASGLPPVTDIGASLEPDAPVVLVDVDAGERVPLWAEIDAGGDDSLLMIRPAESLIEGHRHVVGLRGLVDVDGAPIEPSAAFTALLSGEAGDDPEGRAAQMAGVVRELEQAGVDGEDLYLAWDFTVASQDNLTERLLFMRDDAMAGLGVEAPEFSVSSREAADGVARVEGTVTVPRYLTGDGGPGTWLNNTADSALPSQNGTMQVPFECALPADATAADDLRVGIIGHGLLGNRSVAGSFGAIAAPLGVVGCAMDWLGMSDADVPVIGEILTGDRPFKTIPDRLQQAHLDNLFLSIALTHPEGFGADEAFQDDDGRSLLGDELFYWGVSQGGTVAAPTVAIADRIDRAVFAVPGMNYSLLLRRSVDFDSFAGALSATYPDRVDQQVVIALIQMLWDRGENGGYARHVVSDPLPGSEPTEVLLLAAFGDHQVHNLASESLARTMGVPAQLPLVEDGRSPEVDPAFGLDPIGSFPHDGSGLVMWDWGTPPWPVENVPPTEGDDPHDFHFETPAVLALYNAFLQPDGELIDVCDAAACQAPPP